jgi:hypothetical protein
VTAADYNDIETGGENHDVQSGRTRYNTKEADFTSNFIVKLTPAPQGHLNAGENVIVTAVQVYQRVAAFIVKLTPV